MQNLNARVFALQGAFCSLQSVSVAYFVQAFQRFGYGNSLIGVVMMLGSIVLMAAQPFWGMLADKTSKTRRLVLLNCSAAAALYFVFIYSGGERALVIPAAMGIYALFQPMMNLIDSWISKLIVDGYAINYGATRTGGSVFYALTSLGFGFAVVRTGMKIAPWIFLAILGVLFLAAAGLPDAKLGQGRGEQRVSLRDGAAHLKDSRGFWVFLPAYFLTSLTSVPVATYFPVVVYSLGGNEFHVGLGLFLQCAAEIPVMLAYGALRRRIGLSSKALLVAAMLAYAAKAILLGFAPGLAAALAANAFQGMSYALFLLSSLSFLTENVSRSYLSSAQMLSAAAGSSLASILMNPVGGVIADAIGTQNMLKLVFVFAILGAAIMAFSKTGKNILTSEG